MGYTFGCVLGRDRKPKMEKPSQCILAFVKFDALVSLRTFFVPPWRMLYPAEMPGKDAPATYGRGAQV
jgi:hypothetical protein